MAVATAQSLTLTSIFFRNSPLWVILGIFLLAIALMFSLPVIRIFNNDIYHAPSGINTQKACGSDGIPPFILKAAPLYWLSALSNIFVCLKFYHLMLVEVYLCIAWDLTRKLLSINQLSTVSLITSMDSSNDGVVVFLPSLLNAGHPFLVYFGKTFTIALDVSKVFSWI